MRASSHKAAIKQKWEQVGGLGSRCRIYIRLFAEDKKMRLNPHFHNRSSRNCGEGCARNQLPIRFGFLLITIRLSLITVLRPEGRATQEFSEARKLEPEDSTLDSTCGPQCAIEYRDAQQGCGICCGWACAFYSDSPIAGGAMYGYEHAEPEGVSAWMLCKQSMLRNLV
jgi:hypothetical protein